MPIIKYCILFLNIPRLLLHLVIYFLYKSRIDTDVKANLDHAQVNCGKRIGFLYLLVFDKPFRNLFYWRVGKAKYLIWYWLWPHPCFTLATDMKVGPGFVCIHPFSTIVNAKSIGNNFTVRNNVTIGNNARGMRPTFGNNVSVNANAVVIGEITLGDNVVVGAGSVVTKSVPANCVVVGNPAYIIRENGVPIKKTL